MRQEQVDATHIRDEMLRNELAGRILLLGVFQGTLKVSEILCHRLLQVAVNRMTAAQFVEHGLALGCIERPYHDIALARAEPRPHARCRACIKRPAHGIDIERMVRRGWKSRLHTCGTSLRRIISSTVMALFIKRRPLQQIA